MTHIFDSYLGQLTKALDAAALNSAGESDAFEAIDATRLLEECAATARRDLPYLSELCSHSYAHPNGFTKLRLLSSSAPWALRLHVWSEPVASTNDIHDHCGGFHSRVLQGAIVNEEYVETSNESGFYTLHEDRLVNGVHTVIPVASTALQPSSSVTIRAGEMYSMHPDVIHRTRPREPYPVVTLVLEGRREKQVSRVYRAPAGGGPTHVQVQCDKRLVFETIEKVLRDAV